MKTKIYFLCLIELLFIVPSKSQEPYKTNTLPKTTNYIPALRDTLAHLAERSENEFLKIHFESMLLVIDSKENLSYNDSVFLEAVYNAFNNESDTCSPKELSTYLKRRRPLILAWESPTDGAISFSQLKPPVHWEPEQEYPLYIKLHGLWDEASNSIQYMTYPFRNDPSTAYSFEDGYLLSPWGRGNIWYQGISETDIWECIAALEEIVSIDPTRKYLSGHSMGGYGAWHIASCSANTWAALGIQAGALWYSSNEVTSTVADALKDLPTYFVCGTNDGLLSINQTAYQLLVDAGNQNIEFVTFAGGHESLEENVYSMYLWMRKFVNDDYNSLDPGPRPLTTQSVRLLNYPNPFSTQTLITYVLPDEAYVCLEVYNQMGQKIVTLTEGNFSAGKHNVLWVPKELPEGVYICRLSTGSLIDSIKLNFY